MRRALGVLSLLLLTVTACQPKISPEALKQWQAQPLYIYCNIHYESEDVVDANYHVGSVLPFGSPITVEAASDDSVTFRGPNGTKHTLYQGYGAAQESGAQYFHKIFVDADPHTLFASSPSKVQEAIKD